jgi:hypothetical protein
LVAGLGCASVPTDVDLLRATAQWAARNAYLGLIAGALLVVTRTISFTPPREVRVGTTDVAQIVGDAPRQEFAATLSNPQAVQVRATLRLYSDNELIVGAPEPEMDALGKLLSQPVVTTILGMNATVEQTVRLEDGALEVDLTVHATPRIGASNASSKGPPTLVLESEILVRSRRTPWWRGRPTKRIHLANHAFLERVELDGHRVVFAVDGHLFSLDLELHRPLGAPASGTFATTP